MIKMSKIGYKSQNWDRMIILSWGRKFKTGTERSKLGHKGIGR